MSEIPPITVAVDGYSSCGKSTLAKELASRLGYLYVDTGAMYRAATLYAIEQGMYSENGLDTERLIRELDRINITFRHNPVVGLFEVVLNGECIEEKIRGMRVSEKVSEVSAIPELRDKMVALQREMDREGGIVMDGRDIGTVVFPHARLKLFMTASEAVRAQRRYNELTQKGKSVTLDEVIQNLHDRDYKDTHREVSPLRQAEDAVVIDNSDLSREEQLELALSLVKERASAKVD